MSDLRSRYVVAIECEIERWEREPMIWGYDDCLTALANIDRQVTGIDTAAAWRGRYGDAGGARRLLGRRGVYGAIARAARLHGWSEISPAEGEAGDRGLMSGMYGLSGAIFDGRDWVARLDPGVMQSPSQFVRCAWSIQCLRS